MQALGLVRIEKNQRWEIRIFVLKSVKYLNCAYNF